MLDMDKKWFKHFYKVLKHVNIWVILAVAVMAGITSIVALRNNNLTALTLRDKVIQVDKEDGDIEAALRDLREYIYGHMNTSLSTGDSSIKQPIQLKYRYERLVAAEQNRLSAENGKIYQEAQAECEKLFPVGLSGSGRIPCITTYVSERGIQQKEIPDSLYKFDFVSPAWSPDLAGWSLVITSIAFALFVVRFGVERWVKAELHDL